MRNWEVPQRVTRQRGEVDTLAARNGVWARRDTERPGTEDVEVGADEWGREGAIQPSDEKGLGQGLACAREVSLLAGLESGHFRLSICG